jgi:glucose-6-phosphate 1-dehydrogenase
MTDLFEQAAAAERRADAIVVFGVTGDLVAKKIFPALAALAARGSLRVPVIGVGRTRWSDHDLRTAARRALDAGEGEEADRLAPLLEQLRMVSGDYGDAETYRRLRQALGGARGPVFYLSTPPSVFPHVLHGLEDSGLAKTGRVVIEKPFGHDLASAGALEAQLRSAFPDERIFRVDHYLGKESVEGLEVLRFENTLFEAAWDREHIAAVEITLAEQLGTESRPGFYDGVGALRDVVQNHVLAILALLTMERPVDTSERAFHDAQADLLRAVRPLRPADLVRGQYEGYLDQPGVASESRTETFVAAELRIDSPRWAGVPFRVRAGKRMAEAAAEIVVEFKPAARVADPGSAGTPWYGGSVRFRLGRDDGVTILLQAKAPGRDPVSRPVRLSVDYDNALGRRQDAYERLLDDVMEGLSRRFARFDALEAQWRIVADVLDLPDRPLPYSRDSWGPVTEHGLGAHRWHPVGDAAELQPPISGPEATP